LPLAARLRSKRHRGRGGPGRPTRIKLMTRADDDAERSFEEEWRA
jgi:hypothetical protein